ncbi:ricin-type beta-trefoil lectin domain protein [Streptomyces sp. VNUA116]|uniref:ricin-type beta-trefoil lectin domain protein n=1 Tax=Streptomyces sp. VNUA116 TaxID=3062449 RepID=UPI002676996B|nr:ricin-type beta-trefoil lectin domain protein [Streptomyces sp. VNUA116]WKU47144.1 ricin-type beta-trefoil lectin domain protein [Streptomyces sp. VNUA116]
MRHSLRATAAIIGAVAALGVAAPTAGADAAATPPAPSGALRIHNGALGGCLTAEGSGYRDPRGALRPWLVALQPCRESERAAQTWYYSSATHQFSSQAQPYRCIGADSGRPGALLVTVPCDADAAGQRFRTERTGSGERQKVVAEEGGRIWEQAAHRTGGSRDATGEGVRTVRDAGSAGAERSWLLSRD